MIGKTISHYKILEKLGEGGMGEVYKAQDLKLDRFVALKFLPHHLLANEEDKVRFRHEAKAASTLNHANIMTIHDIHEEEGETFIAMECIEGESLRDKLEKGPLRTKELLKIAIQVSEGLQAAHEAEIVHRDIKTENIMISKDGQIKILDFGLAKRKGMSKITRTGSTLGTLAYMSPEQVEGLEVDRRSDLYSLGVVLYEMATGRKPFEGEHDAAVMYSIVNEEPIPVLTLNPNVPQELDRIIHKALRKEPENRFQHADDLAADLKSLKKDSDSGRTSITKTYPTVPTPPATKPTSRAPWYTLGVVLVVVIVGAVYLILKPDTSEAPVPEINPKSIAVLPFTTISRTEEDEIFSDGIHDDILAQLAKIGDLKVISRTSVNQYKGTQKTMREIAAELNVANILEGSVRRAGDRIRIVAQLAKADTDEHLWAETYDRDYADIFAIQSDVAQKIASALKANLTPEEKDYIEEKPTANMEAYDYFLKGNYYWNTKTTKEGNLKAAQMYEKAIELDPDFALAYARLSIVHSALYVQLIWDHTQERLRQARTTMEKATELDPDHPEVHFARGFYYESCLRDYDRALDEYELAFQGQPNNGEIARHLGGPYSRRGQWDRAEEYLLKAYELDPKGINVAFAVAWYYRDQRDWERAERYYNLAINADPEHGYYHGWKAFNFLFGYGDIDQARKTIEEGVKNVGTSRMALYRFWMEIYSRNYQEALLVAKSYSILKNRSLYKGLAYYFLKEDSASRAEFDSARVIYEQFLKDDPESASYHSSLGLAYAGLGMKEAAIREGKRAVELIPITKDALDGPSRLRNLGRIYVIVGEYDLAIDQFEHLLSIPSYVSKWRLKLDPLFDPLRGHPRFQKLIAEG